MSIASKVIGDSDAFFRRNGFDPRTRSLCDNFIQNEFPEALGTLFQAPLPQGYCSYTVAVDGSRIVQFRPRAFRLEESINTSAREILRDLVPRTECIAVIHGILQSDKADRISDELHVYVLDRVCGVTLDELQSSDLSDGNLIAIKKRLLKGLGAVFATTYVNGTNASASDLRKGKVGSSLTWRLQLLQGIESEEIRVVVKEVQERLNDIEQLPWCLTHGDLVPANVMLDVSCGNLSGLIDWAEGEYLPFGVGLYGIEELLGSEGNGLFHYHPQHGVLRQVFWDSFRKTLHKYGVNINGASWDRILLARKLGILLWRGIAFEDGRIDRVVKMDVDDSELRKLHLFLAGENPIPAKFHDKPFYQTMGLCLIGVSARIWRTMGAFTARILRQMKT